MKYNGNTGFITPLKVCYLGRGQKSAIRSLLGGQSGEVTKNKSLHAERPQRLNLFDQMLFVGGGSCKDASYQCNWTSDHMVKGNIQLIKQVLSTCLWEPQ